jgi:peptidoglycan/LPS O-acetylase OafA/YrhL
VLGLSSPDTATTNRQEMPDFVGHVGAQAEQSRQPSYRPSSYCVRVFASAPKQLLGTDVAGPRYAIETAHSRTIEGLRGFSVLAVLFYHFFPSALPGGFIGVDVFFVVSGYLVVGSIAQKVIRGEKLSIVSFWSARIARVAPVAICVLVFVLVVVATSSPTDELQTLSNQLRFAATFRANVFFGNNSVNYLGGDASKSFVLHFWSLAIEEQIYVLVPVLGILLGAIWRKIVPGKREGSMKLFLLALTLLSFGWCLRTTAVAPPLAFFGLLPRVWQFSLGALVRIGFTKPMSWKWAKSLGVAGALLIAVSLGLFSPATAYPGSAALAPTCGTGLLLLVSKFHDGKFAAQAVPRWFGRLSYSLYMWHWPMLKLFAPAGRLERLLVGLFAILIARLSLQYLENPSRNYLKAHRFVGIAGLGVVVAGFVSASSVLPNLRLDEKLVPGSVVTARMLNFARSDLPHIYEDGCHLSQLAESAPKKCVYGVVNSKTEIVLFGDSHAAQWFPALEVMAEERGWRLRSLTKSSCPFSDVAQFSEALRRRYVECDNWRRNAISYIQKLPSSSFIFVSESSDYENLLSKISGKMLGKQGSHNEFLRGKERSLGLISKTGYRNVIEIVDTPRFEADPLVCISKQSVSSCSFLPLTTRSLPSSLVAEVDMNRLICPEVCSPIIGETVTYRDSHHLAAKFARKLAAAFGIFTDKAITASRR